MATAPVRITTAATSPADEIAARQRRYVVSMSIRTVCFIGAVVVGPGWLRWVLIAGAVLLPYIAVVMANAVNARDDGFALGAAPPSRRALPGSAEDDDAAPYDAAHDTVRQAQDPQDDAPSGTVDTAEESGDTRPGGSPGATPEVSRPADDEPNHDPKHDADAA